MLPSPVGEPSRQSTRNPISLRLYKVLATNYDDPSTREALLSVSKFYSIQDSDNASGVPTKHGELAARARKNLRRDLESRLAAGSRQFLDAFKTVDEVGRPQLADAPC
jgi:conserved oligomeric Golgi complex subunit 6